MVQPFRQVHLDFHTSPHIPEVGADFDPEEFITTLRAAHVKAINVFAKCHHGYSYYPTRVGTPHPDLKRPDLLGEMIRAGHEAGLQVVIYTTAIWDELAWAGHPEWRQLSPDGHIAGPAHSPLESGWKNLCLNTGYADYFISQLEELLDLYDGDGIWIDIVFDRFRSACTCATCLAEMVEQGIDPTDQQQLLAFALQTGRRFMARTTRLIRSRNPNATIYYNARLEMEWDPALGSRPELENFTHIEIESLPGGFWGYDHAPIQLRYFQTFGLDLIAMVGRFHTSWGDFGGLRNRAALEFECFQALAHGARCSIGDQLHPRGQLEPAVYQRIGEVYARVEQREAWCVDTQPLPDIGVITANRRAAAYDINDSDRGALHVLEQLKHQFLFLDAGSDLSPYPVVLLPDDVLVDPALAGKIRAYLGAGGRLLVTASSGLDPASGDFVLAQEMGAHYAGPPDFTPDYLLLEPDLAEGIEPMPYVCELPGTKITLEPGVQVLAYSGAPYFNRTWQHFCSHQYTPLERRTAEPLIFQKGSLLYIARPLFKEYAVSARRVHKLVIGNCLKRLLPQPRVGAHNLPGTAIVTVRRQGRHLLVHLLHYVHQRRGKNLDIIEDVLPLYDVELSIRTEQRPGNVRLVPQGVEVEWSWQAGYTYFRLPRVNGYEIVQLTDAAG